MKTAEEYFELNKDEFWNDKLTIEQSVTKFMDKYAEYYYAEKLKEPEIAKL